MPGPGSPYRTWNPGDQLTAEDLSASFVLVATTQMTPDFMDDHSVNAGQMQAAADPYPGAVESLASTLSGELQRLRYAIAMAAGRAAADWYKHTAAGGNAVAVGCQGRLEYVSATQIKLVPVNGNRVYIPGTGKSYAIPSAGVTLANTGLTAATPYRVYLFENAGTLTLEAVITARATDTSTGLPIKSADATRLFVGLVYMGPGTPGIFIDAANQRFVGSYWNRRLRPATGTATVDVTVSGITWAEASAVFRAEFVSFGDESVPLSASGFFGGAITGVAYLGLGLDGATNRIGPGSAMNIAGGIVPIGLSGSAIPGEGYSFLTLAYSATAGTISIYGSATAGQASQTQALVRI